MSVLFKDHSKCIMTLETLWLTPFILELKHNTVFPSYVTKSIYQWSLKAFNNPPIFDYSKMGFSPLKENHFYQDRRILW